ncbi:MAG: hypothetical protein ACKOCH_20355, partial [Bacteroidota bacterium]
LWITSDGGVNYSPDFGASMDARMNGISGSDNWGFDAGWNEDVLVGGRYHNGNMAWHESFPEGKFYRMGGAEAATGYLNPGDARKTYHSDIGGYRLKGGFKDGVTYFPVGLFPNESYAYYANSETAGQQTTVYRARTGDCGYRTAALLPRKTRIRSVRIVQSDKITSKY